MKPKVYIETSVVSYLSGRLSRDVVIVGRQEITREIWPLLTAQFDCCVSVLVREEIERGDPEAASSRLAALAGIAVLTISKDARDLAKVMIENRLIPSQLRSGRHRGRLAETREGIGSCDDLVASQAHGSEKEVRPKVHLILHGWKGKAGWNEK